MGNNGQKWTTWENGQKSAKMEQNRPKWAKNLLLKKV